MTLKQGCLQSTDLTAKEITLQKDCDHGARSSEPTTSAQMDSGLECLLTLAHFHQISASHTQLKHAFGHGESDQGELGQAAFDTQTLLRAVPHYRLKRKACC